MVSNLTVKVGADIAGLQKELNKASGQLAGFGKSVSGIGNQLKGLFAGFGLLKIGQDVISTTSEFQKFEAVLSNTLGSNSEAQKALANIKDFAQTTPFEVSEVTAAYVRWANQGLTPTIDKMGKLGDIASSLGAGFEQTAEAFKDLAVGQTKRIEEIGISAQQSNGKIQLSFKGVNIEIEKNAQGVQKALEVYSQLNGVLGTSDAVSKTLGGRISNLNDAWAGLMLSIGNGTSGPMFAAVESLTTITNALANFGSEMALIGQAISPFHDLRDVSKETLDYLMKFGQTDTGKKVADILKPLTDQKNIDFLNNYKQNYKDFVDILSNEGESIADINVLWNHYLQKRIESQKADNEASTQATRNAVMEAKAIAQKNVELAKEEKLKNKKAGIVNPGTTLSGIINTPETLGSSIGGMNTVLKNANAVMNEFQDKLRDTSAIYNESFQSISNTALDIGPLISQSMADMVGSFAESIGSMAAGASGINDVGAIILSGVAAIAGSLGKAMIAFGFASEALRELIKNPYTAIAAGIALVALSKYASTKANAIVNSGGGGSGGGSSNGLNSVNARPITNDPNDGKREFTIHLKAKGSDLIGVIDEQHRRDGKIKG